jgi:hypothetical protein
LLEQDIDVCPRCVPERQIAQKLCYCFNIVKIKWQNIIIVLPKQLFLLFVEEVYSLLKEVDYLNLLEDELCNHMT